MHTKNIVGIDVSKATLDLNWLPDGEHKKLSNSREGIVKLIELLEKISPELVVLEATGGYHRGPVEAMQAAGIAVHVANPRQVRDFARSLNKLCKTDKVDAAVLAQYGQSREFRPTVPRTDGQRAISELLLRRDQLNDMVVAENNRLEHASLAMAADIKEHVALMKRHLLHCDKEIRRHIDADAGFSRLDQIIQSVPGFGPVVSATLISELPELGILNGKEIASLVGVAPFNRDSGGYRGQRHIWSGRARIRCALYAAMRATLVFNARVRCWFERFIGRGKAYKVAVIACIRKLLVILNSMVKTNTLWRADFEVQGYCERAGAFFESAIPQKCHAAKNVTARLET